MAGDSKIAEKEYLRRSGGGAWEREKPFSPAGTDNFQEGLELLNDFVVALWLLQPRPDDRILDLGAGGGWCSDLLRRMGRRAFPVDISWDMLRIARDRPTGAQLQPTVGDLERLPFADGAFDKAVCLSALHHVPNMGAAVREIYRVLGDDGVVVFSEPGVGHATKPWSVAATRDFGVLEQEVHIEPTIRLCREAGFTNVRVCPISYVIPEFGLTDDDWRAWMRLPQTKRPIRAAEKVWRGVLELVGLGKRTVLFEEAFAMRLVRLLQVPVQEHPFIVAAKGAEHGRRGPAYQASIEAAASPLKVAPNERIGIRATVTNTGSVIWRPPSVDRHVGAVQLGVQLLDEQQRVVDRDFGRIPLPRDVKPGETVSVDASVAAPSTRGRFALKLDLVCEGRTWFEPGGSAVTTFQIEVS